METTPLKTWAESAPRRSALAAARAKVVSVVENQAPTKALPVELPVTEGRMQATGEVCQESLLAMVVIPELRISDMGNVDVTRFAVTPLFEDNA